MENKNILIAFVFIVLALQIVNAEIYTSSRVYIDYENNVVTQSGQLQLLDTSDKNVCAKRLTPVMLYYSYQDLPYNISQYYPEYQNAYVDECNLTIRHTKNDYDSLYNVINSTVFVYNYSFSNMNASVDSQSFNLFDRDVVNYEMSCHYTNNQTLFIDNVLFGLVMNSFPAFECKGCDSHSFEELSRENENAISIIDSQKGIYTKFYNVTNMMNKVWNISSWLVKIALIFLALTLITIPVMFIYKIFKEVLR